MADSLVISGKIELLGGEAASTDPRCPGAQFMLAPGFDLSAPQPTTDFVASLILDGEKPFGRRASNRQVTLPLVIKAPTRAILAAAREVLEETIDHQTWTLTWTRDPGPGGTALPLVLDCFRAQPTVPVYNTSYEKQANLGQLTITFEALPYGRSDTQQQIAFAAPVPASPPPPAPPVVLDNFTTISSTQFSQSPRCIVGPWTACWDPDDPRIGDPGGQRTPLAYGAAFTSPLNLAGMVSLQLWFGLGSRYYWNLHDRSGRLKVSFYITLTDTNGTSLSFSRSGLTLPSSGDPNSPAFSRVTISIPQGSATFLYASVASYSLTVTSHDSVPCLRWVTGYLDALTAYPPSQTVTPVTRGSVYTLYGVQGTSHTPVSLQFQQAPAPGTPTTITATGAGTYTVPALTAWLKIECVGGGGAGASQTVAGFGGGGGGGEYAAETLFPASAAQVIQYNVGAGGTSGATPADGQDTVFGPGPSGPLVVTANGGMSAAQNSITAGLGGSGSTNSVEYPGGPGRTASGSVGGGGGSSAGSASAGLTPVGTSAVTLTGSGTWTAPAGVTQVTVYAVGAGGGGGSGSSSNDGSGGGGGESATQTFTVVPGSSYTYAVGAGGAGGTASGHSGSGGASSTFTVGAATLTAHGGGAGVSASWNGAGGSGGSGSTAPAHHAGGQGGNSSPYTGGGGSSAGTAAAGNAGNGYASGGIAPSGGGNGGNGSGANNGVGAAGAVPGGGGGGSYNATYAGGAGANGTITVSYPGGAPTSNGAAAVTGGGAGGAGGGSSNTAGSAGSAPGGAGGGADSAGTSEAGGAGAAGHIVITPYASPAFKSLIVHRPAANCPAMFTPLVSVGGGTGVPNGGTEYTMPQPVTNVNATFDGTYTVVLIASSWNSPTSSRVISVTVKQYEYSGGSSYSATTTPVTVSPGVASTFGPGNQVNNGILVAGVLTLPIQAVAPDNTTGYYTVSVTDSNTSDRFYDCIFLDSAGQTVIFNEPSSGYINLYLDEPDPTTDLGRHLGSQLGRPSAVSVMGACQAISGGPLTIPPDESQLFAYSADAAAPAIGVSYYSRWFLDRTG
jgi:hypothetical protein